MKERIEALLREAEEKIRGAKNELSLQEIKSAILGKQGSITELLKEIPKLDVSLRPEMGKTVNLAKNKLTELVEKRRAELKLKQSEISPDFDVTVPGTPPPAGGLFLAGRNP